MEKHSYRCGFRFRKDNKIIKSAYKFAGINHSAGLTLEAALVLPIFLFITLSLFSLMEMLAVHTKVDVALHQVGREMSVYAYAYDNLPDLTTGEKELQDDNPEESPVNSLPEEEAEESSKETESIDVEELKDNAASIAGTAYAYERCVALLGADYLNDSVIEGGVLGLSFLRSSFSAKTGEIDLIVTYTVKPWCSFNNVGKMRLMNRCRVNAWTGYHKSSENGDGEDPIVFVTENGTVYHTFRDCSHLKLDIREVGFDALSGERNTNGGKYYPCEKCVPKEGFSGDSVYIAADGDRYHSTVTCSGLKRTVYEIRLSQVGNRGLCSRCSGRERN
ncbi:MAG: pilus assembly protein [Lachnospiraceae bacterium]|nr:pilus assembly protein [Lachnospiraceae bacterium]